MTASEQDGQSWKWDIFISHASDDKETFVRPLAGALASLGVRVWYDEFSLRPGQSLARSIDEGLAESSYGLVVISPAFIAKRWTEYELRGLVARDVDEGRVIIPVWHGVTRDDVRVFSPSLSDMVAIRTAGVGASDVALQILREVRPDLYAAHPRSQLERIANGQALMDLQEEIDRTREALRYAQEDLAEYRCRFCNAPLAERMSAPVDGSEGDWDLREIYACGYQSFGGFKERPCPSDPEFPAFNEYELRFTHHEAEPHWKWHCSVVPMTRSARRLSLGGGMGNTREESERSVREEYERCARPYEA